MTLQELAREKNELMGELRELNKLNNDPNHRWTDENQQAWDRIDHSLDNNQRLTRAAELDALGQDSSTRFGREDRTGNHGGDSSLATPKQHSGEFFRDTATGRAVPVVRGNESFADAVASMRGGDDRNREGYEDLSLGRMLRALATGTQADAERRALSEGLDSAGGYTVPDILGTRAIDLMRPKSRVMQAGTATIPLASDRHSFAKLLTDPTPSWRAELGAVGTGDPTFGQVTFVPKSLAVLVRVSHELLEDSVNIEQALNTSLAQAMANEVDRAVLLGSGASNQPTGLANMSNGINEVSMGTNGGAITNYTDVLDAVKLLQDDNNGEVDALIMAPRTHRVFAGLTDTTGQPLRRPFSLENIPFLETSQVPVDQTQGTATDASSIYLGDFSELVLGMRSGMHVEVLKERYADTLEVGFLVHMRVDVQAWREQSLCRIVGITP